MDLSFILNELGEDREAYFNAIAPPIIQSSNFAFNTVEDMRQAFLEEKKGGSVQQYLYSRGMNPTVEILRKKLAALDGAEEALVFNNGAAAIFAAVFANVKAGDHIVSVRDPYTWARHTFDVILPRFKVSTTYVEGRTVQDFEGVITPQTKIIYLESPNSWDYALQPLEEIAALARTKNIITIIDNSHCTPLYQKPVSLGIDISMQTATKYIGGHSDTLGGVLAGTSAMMQKIFASEYLCLGNGIQPFNAWLLLRGLRTLPMRLERISRTTNEVVTWLKSHPKIEQVIFPFDPSFPQYELAKKQMSGCCGLLTIVLKDVDAAGITRFCQQLKHIKMAVSWGGHESLVIPRLAGIDSRDFDVTNLQHRQIRLYTGLEEASYLIGDLAQALDSID